MEFWMQICFGFGFGCSRKLLLGGFGDASHRLASVCDVSAMGNMLPNLVFERFAGFWNGEGGEFWTHFGMGNAEELIGKIYLLPENRRFALRTSVRLPYGYLHAVGWKMWMALFSKWHWFNRSSLGSFEPFDWSRIGFVPFKNSSKKIQNNTPQHLAKRSQFENVGVSKMPLGQQHNDTTLCNFSSGAWTAERWKAVDFDLIRIRVVCGEDGRKHGNSLLVRCFFWSKTTKMRGKTNSTQFNYLTGFHWAECECSGNQARTRIFESVDCTLLNGRTPLLCSFPQSSAVHLNANCNFLEQSNHLQRDRHLREASPNTSWNISQGKCCSLAKNISGK